MYLARACLFRVTRGLVKKWYKNDVVNAVVRTICMSALWKGATLRDSGILVAMWGFRYFGAVLTSSRLTISMASYPTPLL